MGQKAGNINKYKEGVIMMKAMKNMILG